MPSMFGWLLIHHSRLLFGNIIQCSQLSKFCLSQVCCWSIRMCVGRWRVVCYRAFSQRNRSQSSYSFGWDCRSLHHGALLGKSQKLCECMLIIQTRHTFDGVRLPSILGMCALNVLLTLNYVVMTYCTVQMKRQLKCAYLLSLFGRINIINRSAFTIWWVLQHCECIGSCWEVCWDR